PTTCSVEPICLFVLSACSLAQGHCLAWLLAPGPNQFGIDHEGAIDGALDTELHAIGLTGHALAQHRFRCAVGCNALVVQQYEAVGETARKAEVVQGSDCHDSTLARQVPNEVH